MYMKLRVCSPSPQISISSIPASFACSDLSTDRSGRLLAPAVVGPVRPVDVVIARDSRLDAEVVEEVPAHPLREELLPAVAVLGHRRIGVGLLQRRDVGVLLELDVVDACGRRKEVPLDPGVLAGHQQVRVDQHGEHARRPVGLDEAHAAHVASDVVDVRHIVDGRAARVERAEIRRSAVDPGGHLVPLVERLEVDRAEVGEALLLEVPNEPSTDEPAGAGDENRFGSFDRGRH